MIFSTFFSYSGVIPRLELEALYIFISSIRKNYPDSEVVIITDHQSASFFRAQDLNVFSVEVKQQTLLLDRVRAYKKLMEKFDQETLFAFMDFDMILLKRFDFLDNSFDCAYTVRPHLKQQPINGGLAVYRNTEKGLAIISRAIKCYEALPTEQKRWWGDQISISSLLLETHSSLQPGLRSLRDGEILLLDAATYNWTPHDFDVSLATLSRNLFIDRPLTNWVGESFGSKYVVHFKGPRKHLQYQFWTNLEDTANPYVDKISRIFSLEMSRIKECGADYFRSNLRPIASHSHLMDLAVLSVLNIFNTRETVCERESVIDIMSSYGDPRVNVLREKHLHTINLSSVSQGL